MKNKNTPLSLPKKQVDLVMGLYSSDKIDEAIAMIERLSRTDHIAYNLLLLKSELQNE